MDQETILRVLEAEGLGAHRDTVAALIRPAIRITATQLAGRPAGWATEKGDGHDDAKAAAFDAAIEALPLGASRFGGVPDLPPGAAWPTRDDVPMEFVAQIRLADVAPHDVRHLLPPAGSLLFFYNSQWTSSDMDRDAACCAVLFHDGPDDALVRTPPPRVPFQSEFSQVPQSAPFVHGVASLRFAPIATAPGGVSPFVTGALAEVWQDFDAYHSAKWYPTEPPYQANHLLGHVGAQDYVDAQTTDDQLLLQVDSDDAAEFQWGDCDRLYFILRADELAARDFSKVRLYSLLG